MAKIKQIKVPTGTTYDLWDAKAEHPGDYYYTCSTAAVTAAKATTNTAGSVTITDSTLVTGTTVYVKFTYGNEASSPTLTVSSCTAKSISGGTTWSAGALIAFTYDGTNWVCAASAGGSGGGFTVVEGTVTSNGGVV